MSADAWRVSSAGMGMTRVLWADDGLHPQEPDHVQSGLKGADGSDGKTGCEKKNAKKSTKQLQGFRVVLISPSRSEKRGLRKKEISGSNC